MTSEVMDEREKIRKKLGELLKEETADYGEIISLTNRLANLDPNSVRFSADAALISRLGRELVSKQETAVSELIKNAYDADATHADLIFHQTGVSGGSLEVFDDGNGMTRDDVVRGFMRVSSVDKIKNPVSPRYQRRRAGKKGIGRFAAQRLGEKLEIVTQTEESDSALRIVIDWTEFVGGRDLGSISSEIEQVPKERDHGTTLVIHDLRDSWSEAAIRRMYRYTSEIIQPFPLAEGSHELSTDPGFHPRVFKESNGDLELIADETTEVYEQSLATIEGFVDDKGEPYSALRSKRLDIEEEVLEVGPRDESQRFEELCDIKFEIHYFIYTQDLIPHGYLITIRELGDEKGGVRVYRNGFRVLPYGEAEDDWLRLDELYRKRSVLPPIGNKHVFGFVAIDDPEGERFEETSSREGLIENQAFQELRHYVHRVLAIAVQRVAEVRGRKRTAGQVDWDKEGESGDRLVAAADELVVAASEAKAGRGDGKGEELEEAEVLRQVVDEVIEELGMLRVLASLGLSVGEFTHEIKNSIGAVAGDASFLTHSLESGTEQLRRAQRLKKNVKSFKAYSAYFDRAVAKNITRELEPQNLQKVVGKFVDSNSKGAAKYGIEIDQPQFEGLSLHTCPMHPSEWPAILFNLYTNAKKAIDRKDDLGQGKIGIRAGRRSDVVYLEFMDNGVGIPEKNRQRVFEAFFTTMPPADFETPDENVLRGSGLGLKIVRDIVKSYGGEIAVVDPMEEYSTSIRIELPAAGEEERP